jgi:opine dehydrogenase
MSHKDVSLAVLGAGNIGLALSGNMALEGLDVSLAELPRFKDNLEYPKKHGGIQVSGEANTGFAKINKITTDIAEAIQGKDQIWVTSISFGHEEFTRLCAPHLEDGQTIVYISYFGALKMIKYLEDLGVDKDVNIVETLSAIYASDRIGTKGIFFPELYRDTNKVQIKRWKEGLQMAAFPANKTKKLLRPIRRIFPSMTAGDNVLETSFFNVNPFGHIPGVILNAGWIEHTKGGFEFKLQGETPAVKKLSSVMNKEKVILAEAFGLNSNSILEKVGKFYDRWYGTPEKKQAHEEKYYVKVNDAPPDLEHRYLTEDIMNAIVPMSYIADVAGVEVPTFKAVVHLSNIVNETNYWEEGSTLEKLGLEGMDKDQILEYVKTGKKT